MRPSSLVLATGLLHALHLALLKRPEARVDDTLHWRLEILLNCLVGDELGCPVAEDDVIEIECGRNFNSLPSLLLQVLLYVVLLGREVGESIESLIDEAL
jgi:hypothetical protein